MTQLCWLQDTPASLDAGMELSGLDSDEEPGDEPGVVDPVHQRPGIVLPKADPKPGSRSTRPSPPPPRCGLLCCQLFFSFSGVPSVNYQRHQG